VVTCYDGTVPLGQQGALSPFGWVPRVGQKEDYYPSGAPAIGLAYLPIFVWTSEQADEAIPVGETYVASGTAAQVTGAALDFTSLLVTTVAFEHSGEVLDMRSRNFDIQHGTGLGQMYAGFEATAPGVYRMWNGDWFFDPAADIDRVIRDRRVVGFARQQGFGAAFSTTVEDGPDCGGSFITEFGNVARPCGADPTSVHWARVPRN
jgi:hypothetical protein